ncbi:MAG: CBS domain-containing protein [Candidatus Thermoplasmatota archaeon]|nr:CBS domain-containing protein [Candidatus Thermoplasmatota archaeon]
MEKLVSINTLKVNDCLSRILATATAQDMLSDVIGKMKKHDIYELPVVEKNKLLGWVSYTNLIKRRKLALSTNVSVVMVSSPEVKLEDSIIDTAELLFSTGFRTLPVTRNKELLGVISRSDIIKVAARIKELANVPAHEIMSSNPISMHENDGIIKAKDLMRDLGVKNLPVINNKNKLVGVVGLKDIVIHFEATREKSTKGEFAGEKIPSDVEIKSLMSSPPIVANPNSKVTEIAELMAKNDISSVIITEAEKPIGIVTQADVLRAIASFKPRDVAYVQITGLEEEPSVYDAMYELIQKSLKKINKMLPPQMLLLDVAKYKPSSKTIKYSVRAKLLTPKRMFIATSRSQLSQWDLMKALDEVLWHLERQVRIDKKKTKDLTKKISKRESAGAKRVDKKFF